MVVEEVSGIFLGLMSVTHILASVDRGGIFQFLWSKCARWQGFNVTRNSLEPVHFSFSC